MEQDRYGSSKKLFIFGMFCLLLSVILIVFGLYISPHVMLGFQYDVPEFIIIWQTKLMHATKYPQGVTGFFMVAFLGFLGFLFGLVAHKISNHIDQNLLIEKQQEQEDRSEPLITNSTIKTLSLTTKIIITTILLLIVLFSVEWLISVPAPV